MLERIVNYLLRNSWNAMSMTLLFSAVPFFGWIAAVIISLVTLRKGFKDGLLVLLISAIPSIVYAMLGMPEHFYFGFLGSHLVAFILSLGLRETASWKTTLQLAALIAALIVLGIHIFVPDIHAYWVHTFENYYKEAKQTLSIRLGVDDLGPIFSMWATFATGMQVSVMLLISLTNIFLARWLQSMVFNPEGFSAELVSIKMDKLTSIIAICFAVISYAFAPVLRDWLPILFLLFILSGISLLHWIIMQKKLSWLWVFGYYFCLILMFQLVAVLTIAFSISDSFMDLRKRLI